MKLIPNRKYGSIQRKLFYSYLAVLMALVLISGLLTVTVLQNILQKEMVDLKKRSVAQMKDKVQLITDHILAVSNIYYVSSEVSSNLSYTMTPGTYEWYHAEAVIREMFYQYDFAFDWLNYSTSIIGYNGRQFHSIPGDAPLNIDNSLLEAVEQQSWFRTLKENEGKVLWLSSPGIEALLPAGFSRTIYAVRELHSMYTGKSIGLLFIGVDINSFDSRLYQGGIQKNETVFILDRNQQVLSSSGTADPSSVPDEEMKNLLQQQKSGHTSISRKGEVYQAVWDSMPPDGWQILSMVKDRNLFAIIYLSKRFLFLILLFCFLSASMVALIMATHISRPIQKLAADMKTVEEGDLDIRSNIDSTDEIGRLAGRFNSMLDKTRDLLQTNLYISQMKQKAELEALQRQVNPHFIYNSLGTIRFMLRLEETGAVEKAIISLNKMLRYTLSGDDSLVMMQQELEMTEAYKSIAEKQLNHPLVLKTDITEDLASLYIPKLILQPLVENAVFHGIKPARKDGSICINAFRNEETLHISVRDNGVGFSFSSLEELRERDKKALDERHNGIGLLNIHDRIVLRFGSSYGLKIESGDTGCLHISLPVLTSAREKEIT